METRYWLKAGDFPWREATPEEFAQAEEAAGFHPKPGCGPVATGGFGNGYLQGRVTHGRITRVKYAHDLEFLRDATASMSKQKGDA